MTDKLILVLYIDVSGVDEHHVPAFVATISRKMFPENVVSSLNATTFTIPRIGGGTTLECIHPKFILDQDVFREYRLKTEELIEHLDHFKKEKGI